MATCKYCIHYYVCNSKGANCREDISSGSKAKYINVKELSIILDIMKNPDSEFATDDYIDGFSDGISAAIKELEAFPTADVAPIRHGRWKTISDSDMSKIVMCSVCNKMFYFTKKRAQLNIDKMPHCPNCGSRMCGEIK